MPIGKCVSNSFRYARVCVFFYEVCVRIRACFQPFYTENELIND